MSGCPLDVMIEPITVSGKKAGRKAAAEQAGREIRMMKKEYCYVGKNLTDDKTWGKVSGGTVFCGDMLAPGQLHMKIAGAAITHGRLVSVDAKEALGVPGVKAVYTAFNTPDRAYDRGRVTPYSGAPFQEKLFDTHIRFRGERIAAVVADTPEHAKKACGLIRAVYEEYPSAILPEEAMDPAALPIHPEGNVWRHPGIRAGNYEECRAARTVSSTAHVGRMNCLSMETHVARASYSRAGRKLTVWSGCQTVFGIRATLGDFLEMPYSKIRVMKTPMGGSFGCKQETVIEPLAAYAALDLEADVMLSYSREEEAVNCMTKHNVDFRVESRVEEDGTVRGMKIHGRLDAGAYMTVSADYLCEIGEKSAKVYAIPDIFFDGEVVYTNTPVNGSFRGWGSSEINVAMETHMNILAGRLGIDPVELRRKNIHRPFDREQISGNSVGSTHFEECLVRGSEAFGWEELKKKCADKNREGGRYRWGVGMALGSHTSSCYPHHIDPGNVLGRIQEDGSLILHAGVHDHGCGAVLALKKIAAEVMELDPLEIQLEEADTEHDLYDFGCFSSRTVYVLGQGVKLCCERLLSSCRELAGAILGENASHLRYEEGCFFGGTEPERKVTLRDCVWYSLRVRGQDVFAIAEVQSEENPGVSCAHFAMVRVDTLSGLVKVEKYLAVHDVGFAINPDRCVAQIGSGIQQGMGIALGEEVKIDPSTGEVLVPNLKDYEVANAADLPDYEVLLIQEGDEKGPFGAKSIGEACVVPAPAALCAAVNDALRTELTHLPLTPAVILEAWENR